MKDDIQIKSIIERLDNDIERFQKELELKRFDYSDPSMKRKLEKYIDASFADKMSVIGNTLKSKQLASMNNWEYLVIKRRKQAVFELLEEIEDRFSKKHPDLCVTDEFINLCGPLNQITFHSLNCEYYIELAAAIWILDYLKSKELFEEASQYLPKSSEALDSVYLPIMTDSVHSDDDLKAMIYVIMNRNKGAKGFDENRAFCDEADTYLKKDDKRESLPDRKNYDAIMSLIEKERLDELDIAFESEIWSFYNELFTLISGQKKNVRKKKKRIMHDLSLQREQYEKSFSIIAPPLNVNSKNTFRSILNSTDPLSEIMPKLDATAKKLDNQVQDIYSAEYDLERIYYMLMIIPAWVSGTLPDDCDMSVYDLLSIPEIKRPYEMCFAFLHLLDSNSDLIWTYNVPYVILALSCQALPWAGSHSIDPDGELGPMPLDFEYLKPLMEESPVWDEKDFNENWYALQIPSPLRTRKKHPISISQLTFLVSNTIPPRSMRDSAFLKPLLAESDLPKEQQDLLYEYISLAYSLHMKDSDYSSLDDNKISSELHQEITESEDKATEIKKLREEVKHLKTIINKIEHQKKDLTNELAESNRKLESTGSELAELRSMIRESCDSNEESPTTVSFPYKVKKRTVIIGGHDSWVKAIKPLLNNVRYIGANEHPNPSVIMNSEIVWIQSNAIGHSSFYKIIDVIRKNDIKVCYFNFASAEKCAEQLAIEDIENNK